MSQTVPDNWGAEMTPTHRDVAYVSGASTGCAGWGSDVGCGGSQTLDIYPAVRGGNKGTVVFVHGGAFVFGDKFPVEHVGPLLRQTHRGYSVVSINYRLTRGAIAQFPAASQDVAAALTWVKANGARFGLNTSKLVVAGHSAGGTLAAVAGLTSNNGGAVWAGTPRVTGWVAISPILDCTSGAKSRELCALWSPSATWNPDPLGAINYWDRNDPPGYLIHGDLDGVVEVENSRRLEAKASNFGVTDLVKLDIVDHYADGRPFHSVTRNHAPMSGANSAELDVWLDAL